MSFTARGGILPRFLLVSVSLVLAAAAQAQQQPLVEFEDGLTAGEGLRHCSSYVLSPRSGASRTMILPSVEGEALALVETNESAEFWRKLPGVKQVANDNEVSSRDITPNDPTFAKQWHLQLIDAPKAWEYTTGGTSPRGDDIVIAVIERRGFQLDHPDLINRYYRAPGEIPGDGIDNDNSGLADDVTGWNFEENRPGFEPNSHGVHVCASIGAETNNGLMGAGIDWGAKLLPFQVDGVNTWVTAIQHIAGLRKRYNESNGTDGAYIVAINMSIGSDDRSCAGNTMLNDAIDRAGRVGIVSIGAAGALEMQM